MLTISPWHGVTTVVMGNCGFGVAPTRPEHRELDPAHARERRGHVPRRARGRPRRRLAVRDVPAVPRRDRAARHRDQRRRAASATRRVRLYVMGEEATEREATADEIARDARASSREALAAGALGFATSKSPTHVGYARQAGAEPRRRRSTRSSALAGALGERGPRHHAGDDRAAASSSRSSRPSPRATGRPVTWTALLAGMLGPGCAPDVLEQSAGAVQRGRRRWCRRSRAGRSTSSSS